MNGGGMDFKKIRLMTEEEWRKFCLKHGLTEREIFVATQILRLQKKGMVLYMSCSKYGDSGYDLGEATLYKVRSSIKQKFGIQGRFDITP